MTPTLRRCFMTLSLIFILMAPLTATTWTWMYYFYEDGTGLDALEDFNELESVGPETDSVRYIILYDSDTDSKDGIYSVQKDPNGQSSTLVSRKISSHMNSGLDMDDWNTLNTFILWTGANYPADHYGLTVWDHGSGIFKEGDNSPASYTDQSITKGCVGDIKLWEMSQAIENFYNSFGTLDIIGFDVCLLGQIETVYQFKDWSDYVIASELTEPGDGWDYAAFSKLSQSADYPADSVAMDIVSYYGDDYSGTSITQAATSTRMLDSLLVPAINDLSEKLQIAAYNHKSDILSAINGAWIADYNVNHHDLGDFAQNIISSETLPAYLKTSAEICLSALSQSVVAEVHEQTGDGPYGLKIWIPQRINSYSTEKNHYLYDLTFSETLWDEFLVELQDPSSTMPVLYVTPTETSLYNYADTVTMTIENIGANTLNWHIENSSNWMTVLDDTSGTGNAQIQIAIEENLSSDFRCDTLVVYGENAQLSPSYFIVSQDYHSAPQFTFSPDSLSITLNSGETGSQDISIQNVGDADLIFSFPEFAAKSRLEKADALNSHEHNFIAQPIKGRDPNTGAKVILGAGGPDAFGYYWIDSNEEQGPEFAWTDISGSGTDAGINSDDDGKTVDIPFIFTFYGESYEQLLVSSNGYITFTPSVGGEMYGNSPMGSVSSDMSNCIAPMWDDLSCHVNGRIYTELVNGKFIIQFNDLCRSSYESGSNEHHTFQIILSQNGLIDIQYLSMNGTLTSATIGIEGPDKSQSLEMAYNTDYIQDSLRIAIAWTPQFVSLDPISGTVSGGESVNVQVNFDAALCDAATYEKSVIISSNDPLNPEALLQTSMTVQGSAGIALSTDTIKVGDGFRDTDYTAQINVYSTGNDTLKFTSITASSNNITIADLQPEFIVPGQSSDINLTFNYHENGTFLDSIIINTNSPNASLAVYITASITGAPRILLSADTLFSSVKYGELDTVDFSIHNTGEHDLEFSFPSVLAAKAADRYTDITIPDYVIPRSKGVAEPIWKTQYNHAGGPDAFGYTWIDTEEYPGLLTNWQSISSLGTTVALSGDDEYKLITLPFEFPFYGVRRSNLNISTNGRLTFDNNTQTNDYSNAAIPSSASPNAFIAPFWDDLLQGDLGKIYARHNTDDNCFVIEFSHWNYWIDLMSGSYGGDINFQVVLYPNGDIIMNYGLINAEVDQATVGIENDEGTTGLNIVYNGDYLQSNMAIFITPALPVTVSLEEAVLSPGDSILVSAYVNSTALSEDILTSLFVSSNDPFSPSHPLSVNIDLLYPVIQVDKDTLQIALAPEQIASADTLIISNTGDDMALITLSSSMEDLLIADPAQLTVLPGQSEEIHILPGSQYAGTAKQDAFYELTIVTDHDLVNDKTIILNTQLHEDGIYGMIPEYTTLHPNYPNPFNPVTRLNFDLAEAGNVEISIFNIRGERVCDLVNSYQDAGTYSLMWNGRNNNGATLSSGIYICRMSTNGIVDFQRMALIK